MPHHALRVLLTVLFLGCAAPRAALHDAGGDGGAADAGSGPHDAGSEDASSVDAAHIDGGEPASDGGGADAGGSEQTDASLDAGPADGGRGDAGVGGDCIYVPATSSSSEILSYTFAGGGFASLGCAPVDPTYWMSGSGMSVTISFATAQSRPSIRVWGMNTDDTAAVSVNGAAYPLDTTTASLAPKVVCGLSPGPDGVAFTGGLLAGANTPAEGNYSYQDVTLETTGVTTITITSQSGAGWGFAGTCAGGAAPF